MEIQSIERSYARWAPIYDYTFGAVTNVGRRHAATLLKDLGGKVLEVGVGTGMALPFYSSRVQVTGIDFSADMLAKARDKVARNGYAHVEALHQMDARTLEFADNSFDSVAAMHLLSVVPEPERVVSEMARVCKPGGTVLIVNHFARDSGWLARLEKLTAPLENLLGWHSDFERSRVLGDPRLRLVEERTLPPLGMMTLMRLIKSA